MNNRKRTALCLLGAALCVFMTFGAALALGRYPITPAALLAGDAMAVRTFTVLRLPRAVMALVGGFGLGAAGFVYQTVFRNPLASPDIIGVSSGASVGAAFAILFVSSGALSTTVCAFAGGLAAVFLSLGLAAAAPGRSKMSLVLAGIAVHALALDSCDILVVLQGGGVAAVLHPRTDPPAVLQAALAAVYGPLELLPVTDCRGRRRLALLPL